jgi:hypothetical protein
MTRQRRSAIDQLRLVILLLAVGLAGSTTAVGGEMTGASQTTDPLPPQWIDLSPQQPVLDDLVSSAARAAGTSTFWVGYEFALRPGVSVGCDCDGHHSIRFDDGDRIVLPRRGENDGEGDAQDDDYDRPFGLFLKVGGNRASGVQAARIVTWERASKLYEPVVWAGFYDAHDSVRFLRPRILESAGVFAARLSVEVRERLLMAVALHDSELAADVAFAALSENEPRDLRESAVMWAATIGGTPAIDRILRLARHDSDSEVRESSIFWLGQLAGDAATSTLVEIAENDPLSEVRRSAVFALSQSEDDAAIDALIKIVHDHDDPEVVRAALFWLGESGDPRAIALFEELLLGRVSG